MIYNLGLNGYSIANGFIFGLINICSSYYIVFNMYKCGHTTTSWLLFICWIICPFILLLQCYLSVMTGSMKLISFIRSMSNNTYNNISRPSNLNNTSETQTIKPQ